MSLKHANFLENSRNIEINAVGGRQPPWTSVDLHGNLRGSVDLRGNLRGTSVDLRGNLRGTLVPLFVNVFCRFWE